MGRDAREVPPSPPDKEAATEEHYPPDLVSSPPIIPIRELHTTIWSGAPPPNFGLSFLLPTPQHPNSLHNKEADMCDSHLWLFWVKHCQRKDGIRPVDPRFMLVLNKFKHTKTTKSLNNVDHFGVDTGCYHKVWLKIWPADDATCRICTFCHQAPLAQIWQPKGVSSLAKICFKMLESALKSYTITFMTWKEISSRIHWWSCIVSDDT